MIIEQHFSDLKLKADRAEWSEYFADTMDILDSMTLAELRVNEKMPAGVKGYRFEPRLGYTIISIKGELDGNTITMSEEEFIAFLHESCHLRHLDCDEGEFKSPCPSFGQLANRELADEHRRDVEYEAGYRSCELALIYDLFDDLTPVIKINVINMLNYDTGWNRLESVKNFRKEHSKDEDFQSKFDEFINREIISKVEKFSSWADPKHSF